MAEITFDPSASLWQLNTSHTTYVFRWDGDSLRHLYWGRQLPARQAATLPAPASPRWLDGVGGDEEVAGGGGARFGPAGVQVRFADGTRGLELDYVGHEICGLDLAVRLADRYYPLEAVAHYRLHPDSDVIERWLTIRVTGGDPITLQRVDSACWVLPARSGWRLSHTIGGWGAENRLERVALPHAETVLTSRRGLTGHQASPWLMLDAGDATETEGEVWSAALTWSGSWTITLAHTPPNRVTVTGGFGHDELTWTVQPGDELCTPVFAGLFNTAGFGTASRAWHAYVRTHVLPHPNEIRPVLFNSWEATEFDIDEARQMDLARTAASLGCELFVIDDGWFGSRTHAASGLGDWDVNRDRFPHGLGSLVALVRRLGMGFGIWVEPEMVNPDSDLYRAHPDWVLHFPHRAGTLQRDQLVLNFARPDVAAWALRWIDALVGEHDIDFLKWDMNRSFTEAGWPGSTDPDRLWIDHVRGVYRIIDRLRVEHPRLRIECCASGGGRADLGMLARSDQIWTSDNTDALDRLTIQHGFSQVLPAAAMAAWVTDSPNLLTGRHVPLRFRFHVAMAGVLGLGGDLPAWSRAEVAEARDLVSAYKRVRHVVQHGEIYRLEGHGTVQYLSDGGNDVVLLVRMLRRRLGVGGDEPLLRLLGLDPEAWYRDTATGTLYAGAVLTEYGLRPDLPPGDFASTLIHLTRHDGV